MTNGDGTVDCSHERHLRRRFERAVRDIVSACGFDLGWSDDWPDENTFFQVVRDRLGNSGHDNLTRDEIEAFHKLTLKEKRRIILTAY